MTRDASLDQQVLRFLNRHRNGTTKLCLQHHVASCPTSDGGLGLLDADRTRDLDITLTALACQGLIVTRTPTCCTGRCCAPTWALTAHGATKADTLAPWPTTTSARLTEPNPNPPSSDAHP